MSRRQDEVPPPPPLRPDGLPVGWVFKPEWEVTPREVRARIEQGEFAGPLGDPRRAVLLDCRREEEWERARIEGAVLIPMDEIERRADELEDEEGGRDRPVIVYCHHGRRSLRVAAALRAMGFKDVKSMAGGIDVWAIDVDPKVARY